MGKKLQNNRMLSALKHGATAGILPHEGRAWRQHLLAVRDALQPVGPVEEALAERAALALWRLRRVAGWEAALVADARERAREPSGLGGRLVPGSPPPRQQAAALSLLRFCLKDWLTPLADAAEVVAEAQDHAALRRGEVAALEQALAALDGDPAGLASLDGDAAAVVGAALQDALDERGVAALAARWGVDPEEVAEVEPTAADLPVLLELVGVERARAVLEEALRTARWDLVWLEEGLAAYAAATAERQARARPDFEELGKLQRYEAHLERVLYRALHELEALQARRQGEAAPLARLEVYGANDLRALDE
jgi:hypothetical protein